MIFCGPAVSARLGSPRQKIILTAAGERAKHQRMKNSQPAHFLTELPIETVGGTFIARYSKHGLAELDFPLHEKKTRKNGPPAATLSRPVKAWHQLAAESLDRVLAGRSPGRLPPLDLSAGTDFQQQVWGELQKIAPGQTRSYGEIARTIGKAKAVRAVGGACGANPIPILVPCHRVLAANRRLGGFSGGLEWKKKLLAREGIEVGG